MSTSKDRLIDAAERLFSERGLTVSIREIVAAAGANVAAVNYHFGSRDGLLTAVVHRKWAAVHEHRKRTIERLVARNPRPTARELVTATIEGARAYAAEEGAAGARWINLTSTLWLTRHPGATAGPTSGDLNEELMRAALPHLSDTAFRIRLTLAADQLASGLRALDPLAAEGTSPATLDDHLAELATFITAGLEAPAVHP
jgi:AcrR family transcriptional regulator